MFAPADHAVLPRMKGCVLPGDRKVCKGNTIGISLGPWRKGSTIQPCEGGLLPHHRIATAYPGPLMR